MLWFVLPRSATLPLTLTTLLLACGGADPVDEGQKDGSAANEDTADGGDGGDGGDSGASADDDTASGDDTADGGDDTGDLGPAPSFAVDVAPIFQEACAGCHYSQPEGLPFGGEGVYDLLVDHASGQLPAMDRVEPGSLAQSYLWLKLQGTHKEAGGSGAEMPPSAGYSPPLSEEQAQVVARWIEGGALP